MNMSPEDIINEAKTSALRGRGGAGFPTGMKWSSAPKDSPKQKYISSALTKSEPGTSDRYLMERDPHAFIEAASSCFRASPKLVTLTRAANTII